MRYSLKAGRAALIGLFVTGIISAGACDSATAPENVGLVPHLEDPIVVVPGSDDPLALPDPRPLPKAPIFVEPVEGKASGTDEWVRDVMKNGRETDQRIHKAPVAE